MLVVVGGIRMMCRGRLHAAVLRGVADCGHCKVWMANEAYRQQQPCNDRLLHIDYLWIAGCSIQDRTTLCVHAIVLGMQMGQSY